MTSKKPRTALAKLLDSMKEIENLEGGSVAKPFAPVSEVHQVEQTTALPQPELPRTTSPSSNSIHDIKLTWLDPNLCQPWQFADRPEDEMGDIEKLAHSLKTVGQQEPVLVRPKKGEANRYEVIFGNRRLRAARLAKVELLAIVKSVDDQAAALYQTEENEERKDLSDLARAKSYKAQLDAGVFESESELSKKLMLSRKTLNDIMAFIRVPEELSIAIPNYKYLSRAMVLKLAALAKDKNILRKLIELAPKIGKKTITTSNLESYLTKRPKRKIENAQQEVIRGDLGETLFTVNLSTKGHVVIKIPASVKGTYNVDALKQTIFNCLTQFPSSEINEGAKEEK